MSDFLSKTLRDVFINCGSNINPGEHLDWRTYELPEGQDTSLVNLINEYVADVNAQAGKTDDIVALRCSSSPFGNPFIQILQKLDFVVKYMCGEFELQTKDKKFRENFAKVGEEFIRGWYFNSIYVGYGAEFEEIDRLKFQKEGKDGELDGVKGKFRLYTKNGSNEFYSVLSQQPALVFDYEQKQRIVRCSANAYMNGFYWGGLGAETLDGIDRYKMAVKALSKQVLLTPKDDMEEKNIKKQMENKEVLLVRKGGMPGADDSTKGDTAIGKTKFDELRVMDRETPAKILEGVQKFFKFHAEQVGYTGENPMLKKERMVTGENFSQQKIVSNMRTYLLTSLNRCFDDMREKFNKDNQIVIPVDIKVVATNQTEAQGMPEKQFGGSFSPFEKKPFQQFNEGFNKFKKPLDIRGND